MSHVYAVKSNVVSLLAFALIVALWLVAAHAGVHQAALNRQPLKHPIS